MTLIQAPELTNRINKRYGIKDRAAAPTLAPEIVAVTLVDDLTVPEFANTQRRYGAVSNNLLGVVAQRAAMIFKNPAGSGVVVTLNDLIVTFNGSTLQVGLHFRSPFTDAGTDNVTQTARYHNTSLHPSVPVIVMAIDNNAPADLSPAFGSLAFVGSSNGPIVFPVRGAVLVPGSSVNVCWTSDGATAVWAAMTFSESSIT